MSHPPRNPSPLTALAPPLAAILRSILNLPRQMGRGLIWLYRHSLSPLIGFHCRHMPTCSQYGDEALARFGLWRGGWMTLARLLRCHPWGTSGIDNVPDELPPRARWFLPWRYGLWRGVNDKTNAACACGQPHGKTPG